MEQFYYGLRLEHNEAKRPIHMPQMHVHPYHELYVLIAGERRYFVGHSIYDVSPGDLVLIPKGCLHRTTAPGHKGYDRYLVYFTEEALSDFVARVGRARFDALLGGGCLQLPHAQVNRVMQALVELEHEQKNPSELAGAILPHRLQEILLTALLFASPKQTHRGESADQVQEIARYIAMHYAEPLSLADAARMAYMEPTYFSKRFKQLTGFGFHEYLMQTRLGAAEQLLATTVLSLGEIAERCGFSGGNYFGDVFRRYRGLSPSEYRKRL